VSAHADILDDRDRLGGAFTGALALHVALVGALAGYQLYSGHRESFGAKDAGGGAIGVEAVNSIPLVHHGAENPVANDTESQVPQTPAKPVEKVKAEKPPPPDAVALKSKKAKKEPAKVASEKQRFRPFKDLDPNQLTNKEAPQVSNNMFSAMPGAGRIGTGANTTLGTRFGAYAQQIQQLVAQKWRTSDVDPSLTTAPTVIATFDLMRDGTARNVRLLQKSGFPSLDSSVQRAILEASPFPPLPREYERESAQVEFWFELKR
jgi:periplasmic protein TonB